MIEDIILLLLSLIVIAKAAQLIINNTIILAKYLRISEMAAGFIILSVSTSLPELVISMVAAADSSSNKSGISLGTLLGANIVDIGVVLSVALLFGRIAVHKKEAASIEKTLAVTAFIPLLLLMRQGALMAVFLLAIFAVYTYYILRERVDIDGIASVSHRSAASSAAKFAVGITMIIAASQFAVDSAVNIAAYFHTSNLFIAATTISLGTTLPELAVSVASIRKKNYSLAIGNVVGSCITNLTLVLGASALISSAPLFPRNPEPFVNVLMFHALMCFTLIFLVRFRRELGRTEGIAFMGIYGMFLLSAILFEAFVVVPK